MVLMLMVAPVFAQKQSPVWKPPCVLADSACWNQINPPAEPGAMLSYVERKLQRPDDIQEATAKATIPPKSEFETTQQYELRKAQAQDSLFLFLTDIDFEYDADHQTITAKVGLAARGKNELF